MGETFAVGEGYALAHSYQENARRKDEPKLVDHRIRIEDWGTIVLPRCRRQHDDRGDATDSCGGLSEDDAGFVGWQGVIRCFFCLW